jgi:hypothetical protein
MSAAIPIQPTDGGSGDGSYPPTSSASTTPAPTATPAPTPPSSTGTTSSTPAPVAVAPTPVATPVSKVSSLVQAVAAPVATSVIPLSPVPSQTLAIALGNQNCTIKVYTRATGLFLDLYVSNQPIALGVICLDRNIMVRAAYLGFRGELSFIDSQGASDPTHDGLGSRYNLVWLDY